MTDPINQDPNHTPHVIPEPMGLHGAIERTVLLFLRDVALAVVPVVATALYSGRFEPEILLAAVSTGVYRGIRDIWPAFRDRTQDAQ